MKIITVTIAVLLLASPALAYVNPDGSRTDFPASKSLSTPQGGGGFACGSGKHLDTDYGDPANNIPPSPTAGQCI